MLKEKGEKKSSLSLLMPGKCLYFILVGGGDLHCRGGEILFPLPSQVQWLKPVRINLIKDRLTREKNSFNYPLMHGLSQGNQSPGGSQMIEVYLLFLKIFIYLFGCAGS